VSHIHHMSPIPPTRTLKQVQNEFCKMTRPKGMGNGDSMLNYVENKQCSTSTS